MISQRQSFRLMVFLGLFTLILFISVSPLQAKKQTRIHSTDPALRLIGFEQHVDMKENSPYKNLKWQFLGPKNVSGRCTDIAVVTPKGKSYTIFVATASGGVWKTNNEGTTWQPVFDQAPSTSIGDVTIAPSDSNILWTGTGEPNIFRSSQAGIGVYKSTDGGESWQHMGLSGTYTISRIVIHPENPDIVYVAASGHEWTNNRERGVYKTTDSGKTWEKIHYIDEKTGAIDLAMDPSDSETLYAATWQRIRLKWNDPRNEPDYTGSGIYKTMDGGNTWKPINNGLPAARYRGRIGIDVARSNPNVVYSAGFYGMISRTDLSIPDRTGRKSLLPRPFENEPRLRGQWVAPFIISPHNHEIIYHGMQYLFRSRDKGDTWERISPDLTYNTRSEMGDIPFHTIFAISESPLKFGLIYVGTDDGKVHVTKNGGKTWQEIIDRLPYQKWISRIVASAYDLSTVYMTQNGKRDDDFTPYVWKSIDYGRTWVDISGNIPIGPVNVIREDPINKDILYVGTDIGVYVTTDSGKTWNVLGSNLPSTYVHDLIIHPRDNFIVIATHGRGM